ncbi:MinD/ParA family protein [Microbacterium sp. STN6]|uniref:MinD/ParA family ATP-binding protein n=1 Tax=Microbacterium sp. STN6 TaxID=2995588 RepID=UPI002260DB9A|nr:MinD/ParA family protein [Microbacterium sp. STN6]MCX7521490.1 MinD/ParA family protein [Microbacterium sp. STN6]
MPERTDKKDARTRTSGPDGAASGDELRAGLESQSDESASVPFVTERTQNLNVVLDLPPVPRHEVPEDEVAVAIDDVAVNPGGLVSPEAATTTSVTIVASRAARLEMAEAAEAASNDAFSQSRRDRLRGEHSAQPEPASMLTADRLLEVNRKTRVAPEGGWNRFLYALTFHLVNLGDSAKVRARKELDHRIQKAFEGGTRFVPVLTRKGGVGKTTVTTLLGMALADAREDRIIAIDANPDRGTLSERVPKQTRATVRDVVTKAPSIGGFTDFSALVSRDETRLDILASDTDPLLSEAFDENDYNVVADLAARFYSIVLTDCGTGIVHSVMRATLQRADSVVIVSGGSVDEARLASETLTWLEANGYGDLVRNAIVALNTATQGTNLVKLDEIESHFRSRVREIVRIPYDPQLAAGSVVSYKDLKSLTKESARHLAALVVEGLPAKRGA